MTAHGITKLAFTAIRQSPDERSEMVSQLLFGETYRIHKELAGWINITTTFDNYPGWISKSQHLSLPETLYERLISNPGPVLNQSFCALESEGGAHLLIGAGSYLPDYDPVSGKLMMGEDTWTVKSLPSGITQAFAAVLNAENVLHTARSFLHVPYLWGGRSVFGMDCSGFVQTVFKIHQLPLPRDASLQANAGRELKTLAEALPGDLAFFVNSDQKIHHVGLLVSHHEIIHCSGFVRLDALDEGGIYHAENKEYTHRNPFFRRLI